MAPLMQRKFGVLRNHTL